MNSWVLYGTIWFIVWVVCLWLVWRMVDRKDLNRALWIILCIFFPVVILIIVALLPRKQRAEPPETLELVTACARRGGRRIAPPAPSAFALRRAQRTPRAVLSTCRAPSRSSGAGRACSCPACCTSRRSGR